MSEVTSHKPLALLVSEKDIKAKIAGISRSAKTLQANMHLVCCSILERLMAHEDVRIIEHFTKALPEGQRTNAVKQWFERFAPVTYQKGKPTFDRMKAQSAEVIARDGFETPFWKLNGNEGAAYVPMDVAVDVNRLITKLDKDMKNTGADHSQLKAMLQAYLAQDTAMKAQADRPVLLLANAA